MIVPIVSFQCRAAREAIYPLASGVKRVRRVLKSRLIEKKKVPGSSKKTSGKGNILEDVRSPFYTPAGLTLTLSVCLQVREETLTSRHHSYLA